jgi:hypothetical protein
VKKGAGMLFFRPNRPYFSSLRAVDGAKVDSPTLIYMCQFNYVYLPFFLTI